MTLAQLLRDDTDSILTLEDPDWRGNFVLHCSPPIYAAYCKLFQQIYTDDSVAADSGSWAAADDSPESNAADSSRYLLILALMVVVSGGANWPTNTGVNFTLNSTKRRSYRCFPTTVGHGHCSTQMKERSTLQPVVD